MKEPYGFIYITTNNINGKQYIGQRKIQNRSEDKTYLGSGIAFYNAIKKYGRENFTREIIEYAYSKDELDDLEEYHIQTNNATKSDRFYNVHGGGCGGSKFEGWSEERLNRFKMEKSMATSGANNPNYGKQHSKETRQRISEARLNSDSTTFQSQEFLDKMSEVTSGENNGMFGKKHTEESKRKMSENSKGTNLGSKNGNFGNVGTRAKNGKPVYKYHDKDLKKLAGEYNTMRLALEDLGLKRHGGIVKASRDGSEYKGYYWSRTRNV